MKKIFVLLVLGLVFAACNPERKYASEISTIENYKKSIDSLKTVYKSIKFDSLIIIQKAALHSEKMIKKHYMADTVSKELAERIQYIKSVRKSLSNIEIKKNAMSREIAAVRRQFNNLEKDIKNGILNRTAVDKFLLAEKEAYVNLSENISTVVENQKKQLKDYYYASPIVNSYVELITPKEN